MTKPRLLDALARAIAAPRHAGRHRAIKLAFAAYRAALDKPWWKKLGVRKSKNAGRESAGVSMESRTTRSGAEQ